MYRAMSTLKYKSHEPESYSELVLMTFRLTILGLEMALLQEGCVKNSTEGEKGFVSWLHGRVSN